MVHSDPAKAVDTSWPVLTALAVALQAAAAYALDAAAAADAASASALVSLNAKLMRPNSDLALLSAASAADVAPDVAASIVSAVPFGASSPNTCK